MVDYYNGLFENVSLLSDDEETSLNVLHLLVSTLLQNLLFMSGSCMNAESFFSVISFVSVDLIL